MLRFVLRSAGTGFGGRSAATGLPRVEGAGEEAGEAEAAAVGSAEMRSMSVIPESCEAMVRERRN